MIEALKRITDILAGMQGITPEEAKLISEAAESAAQEFELAEYKLMRLQKKSRATEILLDETINELQEKRRDIESANLRLTKALDDLRATQAQLVFSEKMASLGELTAGVAHEMQNPLNFVNNFARLSAELLDEMSEETECRLQAGASIAEFAAAQRACADDLAALQGKILEHGLRAENIVKNMLLHTRSGTGAKEIANLHKLIDETLALAYRSMNGQHGEFSCGIVTEYDETIPGISIKPQEISRVFLNLFSNAFYAQNEKLLAGERAYEPELRLSTRLDGAQAIVTVRDNGTGIPKDIIEKIYTPFFTTKPPGAGTGIGLSLAYDMVKGHGGDIRVASEPGRFTEFTVTLPIE